MEPKTYFCNSIWDRLLFSASSLDQKVKQLYVGFGYSLITIYYVAQVTHPPSFLARRVPEEHEHRRAGTQASGADWSCADRHAEDGAS